VCPDTADVPSPARGFVNAHTHMYSGLAPLGLPVPARTPETFIQILEQIWWRLDRAVDASALRASARLYVAEALLHGTTTLVDHHESPNWIDGSLDVLADTCDELGIRAVLCFGATERNGGRDEARRGLAECQRFIRSNHRPLVKGLVGLHASFTVSDATVREAAGLCAEHGLPLHVHMAEARADVDDAVARGYAGPLERLVGLRALPQGSILAHGVHLAADEVALTERLGCWIVQNPRSNRHNGVGYPGALAHSRRVALGTDGFVSDMQAEAAVLREEGARRGEDPDVVQHRADAGHALVAELFGEPDDTCERGPDGCVLHVSIGGRAVVRDGQLQTGDVDEIRRLAQEAAPRLWKRMGELA
jgi:cytosine/adenosine deaminase-related metal-dependent hydrolase